MNQDRIRLLQQFLDEEPEDPFNWYALALEETKTNSERAAELFEYVLKNHPTYLPAYYHAGNLYLSTGNRVRAKEILQSGVNLANEKGEQKSMGELNTLLDQLND
ncbi:MAG: tetratricopeptide repeat protein [Bacteroidota bacterium]